MLDTNVVSAYAAKLLEASRTPEKFLVAAKAYFHHHNYAKFHFDLGGSSVKSVSFANNRYITDDSREQEQLDLVANIPGSFIYTISNSDVDAALKHELQIELNKDVAKTAQAQAGATGQMFDPNVPVIPVHVQPITSTPMQVIPIGGPPPQTQVGSAVVGLQNSMSGSQATNDSVNMNVTTAKDQVRAPSAADEAAARLAELTKQVNVGA